MEVRWPILGVILLSFLTGSVFAEWPPTSDPSVFEISSITTVVNDPDARLTAIDAANLARNLPKNDKRQITLANNSGVSWFSFELSNSTARIQTRILELDYIFFGLSQLYGESQGAFELLDTVDIHKSVFERSVVYRKPAFELTLQPHSTSHFLVRVDTLSKANAAIEIIPTVSTLSAFLSDQLIQNIIFFTLLGLFTALALYNSILFLRINETGYLFYSLYLLTLVSILVLYEGLAFYLPSPIPVSWNIIGMNLSPLIASVFLIAFGRNVLQLQRLMPRINQFYLWAVRIIPALLPLTLLGVGWLNLLLEMSVVLLAVALGVIAGVLSRRGHNAAIYFCISFLFIALGYTIEVTLYSLPLLEILGSDLVFKLIPWIEQYFFYSCAAIEAFFLSLSLASYIDSLKRDKDIAKRNAITQLEQSAKLKTDYADKLELTVQERTAQLSRQQETLFEQNEKLLEMAKLKAQFLANISHEFRTPLTLIKGPLKRLVNKELGALSDDAIKAVETSNRNADRLSLLMEELLTLSHLESNQLKLQVQSIEVNGFCRRLASMFEHQALDTDISFSIELLPDDTSLFFDSSMIETVICNLLSNAFKYTPRQGQVSLIMQAAETESAEPMVSFIIRDTGPGIPEKLQQRIFDRFYRLESHDRSSVEGSGIGLSLVKELVELHGGSVSVTSPENGGSEFAVKLALGFQHFEKDEFSTQLSILPPAIPVNTVSSSVVSEKQHLNHTKKNLLLAEDVHDMREYIASHFQAEYNVVTAGDGQQAWEILQHTPVDVVLTDLMMPIMDGLELLEKIRTDKRFKHLPVLMLTARSSQQDRNDALNQHASDYMAKPFDSNELVLRVRNLTTPMQFQSEVDGMAESGSAHQKLLDDAQQSVLEHLRDNQFDSTQLALALNVSKPTLHRRLSKAANTTPAAFIRDVRLAQAHLLIETETYRTIAEVAHAVGFNSPGYFSRLYKQRFPKE